MGFKILYFLGYMALVATVLSYPEDEGDAPPIGSSEKSSNSTTSNDEYNYLDDDDDETPIIPDEGHLPAIFSMENETNSTDDALPSEPEEEPLDFEAIQALVNEFTNFSSSINTAELLSRLDSLEKHIYRSKVKLGKSIEKEETKFNRFSKLSDQISGIKTKLVDLERQLNALTQGEGVGWFPNSSQGLQRSWATLYRSRGHSGRSTDLDFRGCSAYDECCKNLSDLDNDSQSIHTHDTCVRMYKDIDCTGDSIAFYPGSVLNHQDFGSYNDVFSSGKPCTEGRN